ncbi:MULTISPECIES: bifunctional 2-polyprenyl-6-hydroxyphenol methylase/3-demethylubiquinol 3-O-methyltransferase UbiG [Protofrankia]|uniref:class I SAM-dependent methyltransferase n=1 Tax=Protofrankia TaxID=2994361 RepID=UPI0009FA1A73|nr:MULTISPECIES: class I SAM-dependent methyltransferase [Protofrankia]
MVRHEAATTPRHTTGPRNIAEPRHTAGATPTSDDHNTLLAWAVFGERTVPGVWFERYWFKRHEAAYAAFAPFTTGAVVVEAGCGEGYGAAMLARSASRVIAVDTAADVVEHVRRTYPATTPVRADLQRLPFADATAEVVANLQVIEHLNDQEAFLAECARVLRPAGTLVLTTPNRLTFSPGLDTPANPYHTRELAPDELVSLLEEHFVVTRLWGVWHAPRLRAWERRNGAIVDAQLARPYPQWSAALAERVRRTAIDDFALHPDTADTPITACLDLAVVAYRRP